MADKTVKSVWWSVTAYNNEIELLEDVSGYPIGVSKVFGGREICPKTQRTHFQGCIQLVQQQRMSWFKQWLPTAHLEAARQKDALIKYAMKTDTADGEKILRQSVKKFYSAEDICRLITSKVPDRQTDRQIQFWHAVNEIIIEDPGMTGQLMNPSLKNFWINTATAWKRLELGERDSITHVRDEAPEVEEKCMDCDRETYTCKKCYDSIYNGCEEEGVSQESSS